MRSFRSDNNAGVTPQAMAAMQEAAAGHAIGYGDDDLTRRAAQTIRGLFGADAAVFFTATGTIANTLAVAAMTEPWQRVLCHEHAHWNDDESTAPERFTQCRTTALRASGEDVGKLTPRDVLEGADPGRGDIHQPDPAVLELSNTTEFCTVYTPDEMRDLCAAAREMRCAVHLDGARFANAVAALCARTGEDPVGIARALTVDAGVDAMTFGGSKNGLALGEAAVFFRRADKPERFERAAQRFPRLLKSSGALLAKQRLVAHPFARSIEDGSWLVHAANANQMAARLADGLVSLGYTLRFPVESNGVFVNLSEAQERALVEKGHGFYMFGRTRWRCFRLMCAFDTRPEDVDRFLADAREAASAA